MAASRNHEEPLRCARCGDVIGIYEPLVLVEGLGQRLTSRAAEPEVMHTPGDFFHGACHTAAHAEHNGLPDD
jgi:hypothetical protein